MPKKKVGEEGFVTAFNSMFSSAITLLEETCDFAPAKLKSWKEMRTDRVRKKNVKIILIVFSLYFYVESIFSSHCCCFYCFCWNVNSQFIRTFIDFCASSLWTRIGIDMEMWEWRSGDDILEAAGNFSHFDKPGFTLGRRR